MRIEGLHVDRPIPSRTHDLRQPLGVVLVGLVEPHLQRGLHAPGVQALDVKASAAQAMHQPGRSLIAAPPSRLPLMSPARVTVLSAVSRSCRNIWSGPEAPALQGPQRAYA